MSIISSQMPAISAKVPTISESRLTALNHPLAPKNPFIKFDKEAFNQSIPARFEQQVAQYGDKVAIKTGDEWLTYTTFNENANRIGHAILEKQGPETEPIALMLEQGIWPIVAIMSVLKAGKFYVPLDPSYPRTRLTYLLEDSGAQLIITNTKNISLVRHLAQNKVKVINIDELAPHLSRENLEQVISPEAYAYIMYTSGSTGKPKGVIETHRNILHQIMVLTNELHICPEDRQTLLRSYNFNGSVRDIFGTLLNGATLYPLNIEVEGINHLADWLMTEKITTYRSVTSVYRNFANTLTGNEHFPHLRFIHIGGEPMNKRDIELFKEHFSDNCLLINGFGLTETGTVQHFFINKETDFSDSFIPAGYPSEGKEVLLLDDNHNPVGADEIGEIVVRSRYMSPGYWRRSELTQARFLPDPQGSDARLYLTGDLGRMLPDGCLIHLGRKDFQVKVRGHRIEVAEIEAAVLDLDLVKEIYIIARENELGDHDLVAYLVPIKPERFNVTNLRRALAVALPDYMIPSTFIVLDHLPKTLAGKVDRQALPEPDMNRPQLENVFVAPRNQTEAALASMWCNLLKLEKVGIHDNFFDLGGHSLLAATFFAKIEKTFGRKLPLATLIQAPTIAALAQVLKAESGSTSWSSLVSLQPVGANPPFFFVHAHGGNVIGYYELAQHLGQDRPFYGLQAQGLDGCLRADPVLFEDMAAHYIEEIRSVQPEGPYFIGGWCLGGTLAFEMAQQLQAQGETVALLAMIQPSHPDYPQPQPGTKGIRRLVYRLLDRAGVETGLFLQAGAGEKWSYLVERIKRVAVIITVKLEKKVAPFMARLPLNLGHSQWYALDRVGEGHAQAYRKYEIRPYTGSTTIFRVSKQPLGIEPDPTLGWGGVIKGELTLYEIPGHRLGLFQTPRVQGIAKQLKACLAKAQGEYLQELA